MSLGEKEGRRQNDWGRGEARRGLPVKGKQLQFAAAASSK